jgi:plasmid stabilization system protein ParE
MHRVELHEEAEREYRDALAYYEAERPGYGAVFERAFAAALDAIATRPLTGRRIDGAIRKMSLERFPYAVIYRTDVEPIGVFAVAHHRRQPLYWASRVGR